MLFVASAVHLYPPIVAVHVLPSFLLAGTFVLSLSLLVPLLSLRSSPLVNTKDAVTRTAVTHRETRKLFFETGTSTMNAFRPAQSELGARRHIIPR